MGRLRKEKKVPPCVEFRGRWICRVGDTYRVKNSPEDDYALHHGSFNDIPSAEAWVKERDRLLKEDGVNINLCT